MHAGDIALMVIWVVDVAAAFNFYFDSPTRLGVSVLAATVWFPIVAVLLELRQARRAFVESFCDYGWIGNVLAVGLGLLLFAHLMQFLVAPSPRKTLALAISINALAATYVTLGAIVSFKCLAVP